MESKGVIEVAAEAGDGEALRRARRSVLGPTDGARNAEAREYARARLDQLRIRALRGGFGQRPSHRGLRLPPAGS